MTRLARIRFVPTLLGIMLIVACGQTQVVQQQPAGTRNVILFVGDGFGASQTSLGVLYARLIENREVNIESLMHDGNTGYAMPLPFESIVTDSAAVATQFATGRTVRNETLGLDSDGYPIETILEWAHTGLEMTMDEAREALVRDEQGVARTKDFSSYYVDPDDNAAALIGQALSRHTFVVWATGEHTTDLIPTYGRGPGAEKLRGIYPNTHIHSVMRETLE